MTTEKRRWVVGTKDSVGVALYWFDDKITAGAFSSVVGWEIIDTWEGEIGSLEGKIESAIELYLAKKKKHIEIK